MNTLFKMMGSMSLCIFACSCVSFEIPKYNDNDPSEYDIRLKEVAVPLQFRDTFGEERIGRADSAGMQRLIFENEMIKILWIPTDMFLVFTLENKTDDTLKVMWASAAYVDETGARDAVTHGGVKYVDAFYSNRPKQPSVVISKASVTDWVLPEHCVSRAGGFMAGTGDVKPLFSDDPTSYIGRTVQVMLPLKAGETIIEYAFTFDIKGLMTGE